MKLLPMIILMILIQAALMIFDNTLQENTYTLTPYNSTSENSTNQVYDFVVNPTSWANSTLIVIILVTIALGVASAAIGSIFGLKSDLVLLQPLFVLLIGFGSIPVIGLYNLVNREVGIFACTTGEPCTTSVLFGMFTAGLLGIAYFMACLEWWSGRQTS